jgi:hypothetical protein
MTRVRKGEPTRKHIAEADLKELLDIRSALLRKFHSTLKRLDKLEEDDSKMQEAAKYLIIANRLGKSLFECYRIQYNLPTEEATDDNEGEEEEDLALAWERFQKNQQEQGNKVQLILKKDFRERIQRLKQQLLVIKDDDHYSEQIKLCRDKGRSTGRNQ